MKPAGFFPVLLTFVLAGAVAVFAATLAVGQVERRSITAVSDAMSGNGLPWVDVTADGLLIGLLGTAPDEAARFRAMAVAGRVVDADRVVDEMDVRGADPMAAPDFAVELLHGDQGVTLIGLLPQTIDRQALLSDISSATSGAEIVDLLSVAPHDAPRSWTNALDYAVSVLRLTERAKISVTPSDVSITSMAPDRAKRDRLIRDLRTRQPDGLRVVLDVTAPRPVLAPFLLRVVKDADGTRFEACSAESEASQSAILIAAREIGVPRSEKCQIGLGAPNADWSDAAVAAISSLDVLEAGTVSVTNVDVVLTGAAGTGEAIFQTVVDRLEAALPGGYSLAAVLPEAGVIDPDAGPAEFTATRSPEGQIQLRGRVGSLRGQAVLESFAKALFGHEMVDDASQVSAEVPAGWGPKVMTSLDALSLLASGAAVVEENNVAIRGVSGVAEARDEIARMLIASLGEGAAFEIDVRYDERLDPTSDLPTPAECVRDINTILATQKIIFQPGSDAIDAIADDTLAAIAELLRKCEDVQMEIAGFTDSQGREEMNRDLSERRALAVLAALSDRRVLTSNLTARGYGEDDPVASNDTEAGREANRRIEFSLIEPAEQATATPLTATGQDE